MKSDVARDLSESATVFRDSVWPVISNVVGGGELIPVESVTNDGFSKDLDTLSGIDAWQIRRTSSEIRGIASRVQWGKNHDTFTIRYSRPSGVDTEWQKRLSAIKGSRGFLYPHITTHAYFDQYSRELISVGIVRTKDLYLFIEEKMGNRNVVIRRTAYSGEVFLAVKWRAMKHFGINVKTIERNTP